MKDNLKKIPLFENYKLIYLSYEKINSYEYQFPKVGKYILKIILKDDSCLKISIFRIFPFQ